MAHVSFVPLFALCASFAVSACTMSDSAAPERAVMATPGPNAQATSPNAPVSTTPPKTAPVQPTGEVDQREVEACGADRLRARWTGVMATDAVKAEIAGIVGKRAIRYYRNGDPITMDYSDERLNVVLKSDGRIEAFSCG